MLPQVSIPSRPSCQDCLAWSPDGELAIAAGEEVYLLIPQHGSLDPWTQLRITVSSFTFREWPWQEQTSFKDMSIGEEQARATVTALAWSPPGLAKHRRSVLAVLTSNLILSFWASNSNPTNEDSWARILVVNKALPAESRHQQRIRSIAWAPTNPQDVDRRIPFSRTRWGVFLIAVADDRNGLYILKVSSPFADQSFEWNVEVLHYHSVPIPSLSNSRPSLLSLAMNANCFVDYIEFGVWKGDLPIIYRTSGIIHRAFISVCENKRSLTRPEGPADFEPLTVHLNEVRVSHANMPPRGTITPLIKARMAAEMEKFGSVNNIGGHVMLRRWGLASFDNLAAACITLHPAKMVEYVAPFDGVAIILFDAGEQNGDEKSDAKSVFPWQTLAQVDVAKTQRAILDTILDQRLHRALALNDLDLRIMYTAFCAVLLLNVDNRLQRLQAADEILNSIERRTSIDLLTEHHTLLSIKSSPQQTEQELRNIVRHMTRLRGQDASSARTSEVTLLNLCPFCPGTQSVVPFDSLIEAQCPQHHSFSRCALTFLPLLEPGITKHCIKCKREFINEQSHPGIQMRLSQQLGPLYSRDSNEGDMDAMQENTRLVKHTLASVLFDRFDTCPYCGGKFCG